MRVRYGFQVALAMPVQPLRIYRGGVNLDKSLVQDLPPREGLDPGSLEMKSEQRHRSADSSKKAIQDRQGTLLPIDGTYKGVRKF
jgi:hypothetical protein